MQKYPVTFVVFGATGDLSEKKLFPALFGLYQKKLLPQYFKVVAFARRPFTDESFRELIKASITSVYTGAHETTNFSAVSDLEVFLSHVVYHQGLFEEIKPYIALINRLGEIDKELGACSDKIFHLALSPFFYETVLKNLEASALNLSCTDGTGLTRVLIEKPIGSNLTSAKKINALLGDVFKEEQIFRVDHYLMKNALYDLCTLHLSASGDQDDHLDFLHSLWNADMIESMTISLHETASVHGRGAFYDRVGALRDVGQNHLLEMLSLLLIEKLPSEGDRDKRLYRAQVLSDLASTEIMSAPTVGKHVDMKGYQISRGQYEGYQREEGVAVDSQTETFFRVPFRFTTGRWAGLRVVLEGGKALSESQVRVSVVFRKAVEKTAGIDAIASKIVSCIFIIQPDPGIEIYYENGERKIFPYKKLKLFVNNRTQPDNYERVYTEAMKTDQARFVSKSEVEASWTFIDRVSEALSKVSLTVYQPGSKYQPGSNASGDML
jgi:glucose-6-phosphate 1-dehydrogenase